MLNSSAFDLFYLYSGKKQIEDDCMAIIHAKAAEYRVYTNNDKLYIRWSEMQKAMLKDDKPQIMYWILTEEEIKHYLEWADVFIGTERLRKYFA